jgi:hypothetical protein
LDDIKGASGSLPTFQEFYRKLYHYQNMAFQTLSERTSKMTPLLVRFSLP